MGFDIRVDAEARGEKCRWEEGERGEIFRREEGERPKIEEESARRKN